MQPKVIGMTVYNNSFGAQIQFGPVNRTESVFDFPFGKLRGGVEKVWHHRGPFFHALQVVLNVPRVDLENFRKNPPTAAEIFIAAKVLRKGQKRSTRRSVKCASH